MKKLKFIIYSLLCIGIGTTSAQTAIHSFLNSENPTGSLTYYTNPSGTHYLFGMTPFGGSSYNDGQIFEYNLATSTFTNLYNFNGSDGANPYGSLLIEFGISISDITLYGMTNTGGGTSGGGTIFSYNPNTNALLTLHTFTGSTADGANPYGSLVMYSTTGGNYLLGMTYAGGAYGYGMIFSCLSTSPYTFTDLHDFTGPYTSDGADPYGDLTLVQNYGQDAVVYGMTYGGGVNGLGNIFMYDLTTPSFSNYDLHDFSGNPDGANPYGNVLYTATAGGTLYGLTNLGGTDLQGTLFSYSIPYPSESVLLNFYCTHPGGCIGAYPYGSLVMAGDNLYGTTTWSNGGDGYVFTYDPYTNSYAVPGSFTGSNGSTPLYGSVTLETGVLYGMTQYGGTGSGKGSGVIFQLGNVCDLGIDTSSTLPTCNGVHNGSLTVTPFFGIAPYNYVWSPNVSSIATATGLTGGNTYDVTVTDANGCSASQAMVLQQPSALSIAMDPYCTGGPGHGAVYAFVSGGTSPYGYVWTPVLGSTSIISNLANGNYSVYITDANGCTSSASTTVSCHHAEHQQGDSTISMITSLEDISLYPNPTNGQLTVAGLDNGMSVEIYDYTGRLVSKTTVANETMLFNLSSQSNGIYLVRIIASDGTLVKETKVLKVE